MVAKILKGVIERAETWPEEDQVELVELVRQIEARRAGVYVMNDDERAAVAQARGGGFVPEAEMEAFWRRFGVK
jgi:hypothetical protein